MIRRLKNHPGQAGNVFFALFGGIALVGLVGVSVMTFMKGPLASSIKLTKINSAENQMSVGARVAAMAAASQTNSGDCDSDGFVEPVEWRAATTEPHPTNGGLIPLTLGMSKKDPWGTEYGYCVWNHGSTTSGSGCGANLLAGTSSNLYPVVAIVSAGADKSFTTTCRTYAAADVNSDGDLLDVTDLEMVSKATPNDDDIIFSYTYEEAVGATGGLWNLKSGDPGTAEIAKDIEVSGGATVSGTGSFSGGIILPSSALITCDPSTSGVMARNASGTGLEICDGSAWQAVTGGASPPSGSSDMQLGDETVNATCSAAEIGLMRYNTSGTTGDREVATTSDSVSNTTGGTAVGISFVGYSYARPTPSGAVSVAAPSGLAANDLVIMALSDDVNSSTLTLPAGFTSVANTNYSAADGQKYRVGYKLAIGSETSFDATSSSTSSDFIGVVVVYRGVNAAAPVTATSFNDTNSATGKPWTATGTSVTTTVDGSVIVWVGTGDYSNGAAEGSANYTPPSGFTERIDVDGVGATAWSSLSVSDYTQTTAGATGALVGSLTAGGGGASGDAGAVVIALAPDTSITTGGTTTTNTTTVTTTRSSSNYTEICNGSSWLTVGSGMLNDLSDSADNYTGVAAAATSQSTYSMFLGSGSGGLAIAGSTENTALGQNALYSVTTGTNNTGMGYEALRQTINNSNNTAFGQSALRNKGGTGSNEAFGYSAAYGTSLGYNNTAFGSRALLSNTAGYSSTAVGYQAMRYANSNSSGFTSGNTAVGYNSLLGSATPASNTGTNNTAIGASALVANVAGSDNTALGARALASNLSGSRNSACGIDSLYNNTTGTDNTACGYQAAYGNTVANYNVAVGSGSLYTNKAKSRQVALGYQAMYYSDSSTTAGDTYDTAVGFSAMSMGGGAPGYSGGYNSALGANSLLAGAGTGTYITAIGSGALYNTKNVNYTTALGYYAGYSNTAESDHVFLGAEAGRYTYDGASANRRNTAIGYQALMGSATASNNTGSANVASGYQALKNYTSGTSNVAIGAGAGVNVTSGSDNVAIGYNAIYGVSTGSRNVAVGGSASTYGVLYSINGSDNVVVGNSALAVASGTCSNNVVAGESAMYGVAGSCGGNNVAIGNKALYASTTGANNVAVGGYAGSGLYYTGAAEAASGTAVTTESNNTFIGYNTQLNAAGYTNGMAIGNGALIYASNSITLGNTAITGIYAQVTSITAISDRRHKKDIADMDLGLAFINTLHPVSYRFNNGDDTLRYGFIAQEIEGALPDQLKPLVDQENGLALVTRQKNEEKTYRVNYFELFAPLVKAVQELDRKIETVIAKLDKFMSETSAQLVVFLDGIAAEEVKGKEQSDKLDALDKDLKSLEEKFAVAK